MFRSSTSLCLSALLQAGSFAVVSAAQLAPVEIVEEFDLLARDDLWPGFHPSQYPLAIYDGKQTWLFRHAAPPEGFVPVASLPGAFQMPGRHPALVANSSAELGGLPSATLLLDGAQTQSARSLAAIAVHECFHAYQREQHPTWSANEGVLFEYPLDDVAGLALRTLEVKALTDALAKSSNHAAASWAKLALDLRSERFAFLPENLIAYERTNELNEGLATYVEARCSAADHTEWLQDHTAIRKRGYGTGLALALLLDRVSPTWKEHTGKPEFSSLDETLAQALQAHTMEVPVYGATERSEALRNAEAAVAKYSQELARLRTEFMAAKGHSIQIRLAKDAEVLMLEGFDPLNVQLLGKGEILHSRYLVLSNRSQRIEIQAGRALSTAAGEHPLFEGIRELLITGLASAPTLNEDGPKLELTAPGLHLQLQNAKLQREAERIVIQLGSQ